MTILEARCFGNGELLQVKAATSVGFGAILTVSNNATGAMIGRMVPVHVLVGGHSASIFGKDVFVLYKSRGSGGCPQSVKVTSSRGGGMIQDVNIIELK